MPVPLPAPKPLSGLVSLHFPVHRLKKCLRIRQSKRLQLLSLKLSKIRPYLSHDSHKLDHGKSQVNLRNPQILPTPVIAAKLSHYLEGYDRMFRNKMINGFTHGFKLDFVGERKSSFAPNLLSARELAEIIDSNVAPEVALGRIAGPFGIPPVDPLWVSPVGVVPKKVKGEYRMIQHLS